MCQFVPEIFANRRNSRVLEEIWVEQHDSDVRFQTGSRMSHIRACALRICNITLIYGKLVEFPAAYNKSNKSSAIAEMGDRFATVDMG